MNYKAVKLSGTDRAILETYKIMAEGLADFLGTSYEFVVHSLENLDVSVIKIVNGHHSGRQEGCPITDIGLSMLDKLNENQLANYFSYFTKSNDDVPLKSCTIAIRGEYGQAIGLFCINFHLDAPLHSILQSLLPPTIETGVKEHFAENIDDVIEAAFEEALQQVYGNSHNMGNKNRELISILQDKGIFHLKDSVAGIAKKLGISKNTVYMHIRNIHNSPYQK